MKKLLFAAALLSPATSFAGASVGMNINSYTHLDTGYSTFYTSVEVSVEHAGFRVSADTGEINNHTVSKVSLTYGKGLFVGAGMVNGDHPYATVGYHKDFGSFYVKPQIEGGETWTSKVGIGFNF